MDRPAFTREQLAFLRDLLTPRCCHVSGEHNPVHFKEKKYVCDMQKSKCFDRAREALGFKKVEPQDAIPDPSCGWCAPEKRRKK